MEIRQNPEMLCHWEGLKWEEVQQKNIKQNIKMGNNQQSSQDPAANQDQPVQNQEPAADQPTVDQQPPVAAEVPPPVIDPVISEDPAPSPPVESPTPAEIASLPPEGEQVSIETLADETEKPWTEVTDIALLRNIQQNFVSSTEEHDAISDRIRELNTKSAE